MGNESNMQRLLDGYGWKIEQVMPVLQRLSTDEVHAVQQVWDFIEQYKPMIGALERRLTGREPVWIEPKAVTINGVELRGGYYPVRYDPVASERVSKLSEEKEAQQQTRATVRSSFTKERAREVRDRKIILDLSGVISGTTEVIHYLSWREWIIDSRRLLNNKKLSDTIREKLGPEAKRQLDNWVNDIAVGDVSMQKDGDSFIKRASQYISMSILGYSVKTALVQPVGSTQSIELIGAKWFGSGVAQVMSDGGLPASIRKATAESELMQDRGITMFRELNEIQNRVRGDKLNFIKSNAFLLILITQRAVDIPTYWGAKAKALAAGNNEARAIALAEQAVIDSQGSGMVKDMSGVQRNRDVGWRIFTLFYHYFNTTFNLGYAKVKTADTFEKKVGLIKTAFLLIFLQALWEVLYDAMVPGGDDDDLEDLAIKLAKENATTLVATMVGVRELSYLLRGGGYSGPAGLKVFGDAGNLLTQVKRQVEDGDNEDALITAIIRVTGDLTGLPGTQTVRTYKGVKAIAEGETENPAAVILGHKGR
jgi:hypothetical protein